MLIFELQKAHLSGILSNIYINYFLYQITENKKMMRFM
jgi:hypothetical protein